MQKMYTPARIGVIFTILAVMLTVYVSGLYVIQIHDPMLLDESQATVRRITRRTTLHAARGNIYDRNGVLLASGRASYNIKIDWRTLISSPQPNEKVLALIYATMDEGYTYTDTFPVTRGAPFEFFISMSSTQRSRLDAYMEYHEIDPEISVSDLLAWMRNHYKIDYTIGILDARLIIGVRYELEVRAIVHSITPYIFATDVDTDFIGFIEERGMSGVYAEPVFVREYHTSSAPHLIGYTGRMTAEEYEVYRELGYPMDAIVGKIGSELAFEERLHGISGERVTRMTIDGTIMSDEIVSEPIPGEHITLTLDLSTQIVAEHALRTQIEKINLDREREHVFLDTEDEEEDIFITGGAVVVQLVNTGEILAAATFPSFSLQTLSEDWMALNTDPNNPMLNRATHGTYQPGSTFKMVTALWGLRHVPQITQYYPINDTGSFDKYYTGPDTFIAHCWIYNRHRVGHGDLYLTQALERSCNFYFLQVADWFPQGHRIGAEVLAETAMEFGLGRRTGLEISEAAGRLATPDAKFEATGQGWWNADTLLAGFGQGDNRFTPVQLANYAATIANGGTLYSLSFLRMVRSSDFLETLYTHSPSILNVIDEPDHMALLQEGMLEASRGRNGTATPVFGNYRIPVASKTGTVQIEGRAYNNGVFVCYAPADNPEIAISIVVEKGGSGSAIMDIARIILDHYFTTESTFRAIPYGDLIP